MLQEHQDISPLKLLELPSLEAEKIFNRFSLVEQVSLVLSAPWDKRHELIALSERSMAIVRNMPPQELFWTIKAIGPADALDIISMASPEQIQFMFDLDCWSKDRLVPEKVLAWLILLLEAGETVVPNWLNWLQSRDEFLPSCIVRSFVSVHKRPDDMDIQEARDVLPAFTLDDVYFLEFFKQETMPVIDMFLRLMIEESMEYYHGVLESILWQTAMEQMEYAYRLKRARLEEWGVPDYWEALEIYAPLVTHGIRIADGMDVLSSSYAFSDVAPSFVPTLYVGDYPVLRQALQALVGDRNMERIVFEWIGVANKILVADDCDLDDPEKMLAVLSKTSGFLNLGLELAAITSGEPCERILARSVLEDIVRFAMSEIKALHKDAKKLVDSHLVPSDLLLLPDYQKHLMEGLLRSRPMFWNDKVFRYEEFSHTSQIDSAKKTLKEIMEWAILISRILPHWSVWQGVVPWEGTNIGDYRAVTWQLALGTALVKRVLTSMFIFEPLTLVEVQNICALYKTDPLKCRQSFEDALHFLIKTPLNTDNELGESTGKPIALREETFLPTIDGVCNDLERFVQTYWEEITSERQPDEELAPNVILSVKRNLKYLSSLIVLM